MSRPRALDRPPRDPLCVGLSYLRSYEHMGSVNVECVQGCVCAPMQIAALDEQHRTSLYHTIELLAVSRAHSCTLRLTNTGASSSLVAPAATRESKFKLVGLYLADPVEADESRTASTQKGIPTTALPDKRCLRDPREQSLMRFYGGSS